MALPQDITPFDEQLRDTVVRGSEGEWVEQQPGEAWIKVLWTGAESGRYAALFRWKKGYKPPSHKHLAAVQVYVISGKLQVRDNVMEAGDFLYEPNGMLHYATEALTDVDYLLMGDGPVLFFSDDAFTGYFGWEELRRMEAGAAMPEAGQHAAGS